MIIIEFNEITVSKQLLLLLIIKKNPFLLIYNVYLFKYVYIKKHVIV